MKKVILRLVVLFCIFVGCVIGFSMRMNSRTVVRETGLARPTLPVLYMRISGHTANRMEGHVRALTEVTERSSVTPLPTDRQLTVQLQTFGSRIENVIYQVTDLSDGEVRENGRIGAFSEVDGLQTADFLLEQPLLSGQEYMLRFAVETDGREEPVYYYTRLVQGGSLSAEPYIDFAERFCEACLSNTSEMALSTWLESTRDGASGSFAHLDITASEGRFRWDGLSPELYRRGVPVLEEINETTASVSVAYEIRCLTEEGGEEFYSVNDFFRMRQGQERIVLLDVDRTTSRVFDGSDAVDPEGLSLGLQPEDSIDADADESLEKVTIVTGGDLWLYDRTPNVLARIFTFRESGETDSRAENPNHGIRVVRVGEDGNILFVVYGYMPAGPHEGEDGISVCRYYAEEGAVEESVFLPLEEGYEMLEQDLSHLLFANGDDELYLLLGKKLCRVDLEQASCDILLEDIDPSCFFASESRRTVAWLDPMDERGALTARVLDLESGQSLDIAAESGEKLFGIGFFNEDFVYGCAADADILVDVSGSVTSGMNRILIRGVDGTLEKEYHRDGSFVTKTEWDGSSLALTLSARTETGFQAAGEDHIINNVRRGEDLLWRALSDARTGTHMVLTVAGQHPAENLAVESIPFRRAEGGERVLEVKWPQAEETRYFVYGEGALQGTYERPGEAVLAAEEVKGSVLSGKQKYLWERANWPTTARLSVDDAPAAVLAAEADAAKLSEGLGARYEVVDISGCSADSLFYFLSHGSPVIAKTGADETALIVGYDEYNFWLFAGRGNDPTPIGLNDGTNLFKQNGNIFLTYIEK